MIIKFVFLQTHLSGFERQFTLVSNLLFEHKNIATVNTNHKEPGYIFAKSMEETKTIFIVMVKLVLFKQKITWALFHSHRVSLATPSS